MASDHQESSRHKHRRNSDDESEEPSKRHKHRHHHHHRRHRHHRSRKNEDEVEVKHDAAEEISQPAAPPSLPPPQAVVSNGNLLPDYDMEEGEILEEDEAFVREKKTLDASDVESGEIKFADANLNQNTEGGVVELDCSTSSFEKVGNSPMVLGINKDDDGHSANATLDKKENIGDDIKICDEVNMHRDSSLKHHWKGDIDKDDNIRSLQSSSPEVSQKQKGHSVDESGFRSRSKSISSENAGKRHKLFESTALRDSPHEEERGENRSRSRPRDPARERSRSRSILQEASHLQFYQQDAAYYTGRKRMRDSGGDISSRHHRDYRHGSGDLSRDKERERSSSYSRHTDRLDRYHSPEARDRDWEKNRKSWDGNRERGDMDRDKKREKEQEKVRERARESDRNQERERDREKKRERRDWVRERDRDRESRYREYDRFNRNHKYYDADAGYGDHGSHNDHRHRKHDETDNKNRSSKIDQMVNSSKTDHSERDSEKLRRDELEQENYQERIVLQLAEQEDEEIDRIKEESRKRRQAILEKFKTQQSQQKHEPKINESVPNVVAETRKGDNLAAAQVAEGFVNNKSFSVQKSPKQVEPPVLKVSGIGALGEGTPKSERSDDMFHDDIFGESPAGVRKPGRGDGLPIERSDLHDNWDDPEGYYSYRFGEVLDGRYEVIAAHGKGVFSSVVRAKDLRAGSSDPEEVAIKIIRSNDTMYKAGLEELVILKKLVGADPEDKRHCVRFLSSFKYRNHLCLVFESLHMNLREVLKKFGRNIGLKLTAVRAYAKQLFIALKHLRNCGVLHCDIKPDNMLVNEAKNVLKLCDFGNAMFAGKNEITPYLVSRFYRAPEIILGLPYDHPMDMWSVGCCLYEIYTGKVLFPGPSNNDMLRLHMELKGPFPKKMLRKGAFIDHHFDQDLSFLATEEDPVTKKSMKKMIYNIKPKDIGTIILGSAGEDPKMLSNFKDLLEKIFMLDPDKRITVSQALSHPFITGK